MLGNNKEREREREQRVKRAKRDVKSKIIQVLNRLDGICAFIKEFKKLFKPSNISIRCRVIGGIIVIIVIIFVVNLCGNIKSIATLEQQNFERVEDNQQIKYYHYSNGNQDNLLSTELIKWQTQQTKKWNVTLANGIKMVTHNSTEDKYVSKSLQKSKKLFEQAYIERVINHIELIFSTNGLKPCALQTPKVCKMKNKLSLLDIGANIGVYSLGIANEFRQKYPFFNVISFEPDQRNFALFTKSIQLNKLENIWAFPYGLSDAQTMGQQKEFMIDAINKGHNHVVCNHTWSGQDEKTVKIDVISLDLVQQHFEPKDVMKNTIWMKIDVEGFEKIVFDGAKKYLSNDDAPCFIMTEFRANKEEIMSRLHAFGYLKIDNFDWNKVVQTFPLEQKATKGGFFVKNDTEECVQQKIRYVDTP